MKKISLLMVALATMIGVHAQRTNFGLKAGANASNITNQDTKIGYHLGALAHIHMGPSFAIQPELVYSNQGAKHTLSNGTHNLNLNYVNIPLLFQYMAGTGLRLQTGPQVGFLTSVEDKLNGNVTNHYTASNFKNTEFAWTFGIGYQGNSGLGVDGRYNLGLSNINDAGSGTLKNNVAQVGLFYQFRR